MKVKIAALVEQEEKEELEKYCEQHDIKISQLIRKAVKEYLTKETKENKDE